MSRTNWLVFAAVAVVVGLIAMFAVISRAPVPENAGTAPSVITGNTGSEAEPVTAPPPGTEPREVDSSANAARAARGSGIEGMTSGGTTSAPPGGR
jgi:hypothetical protein